MVFIVSKNSLATVDISQLKQLFNLGYSQQAYDYAVSGLNDNEGDPEFDYYYGTSAIDIGKASEGVFALERVLISQPGNVAARLELARGYFILEEYARSREEFRLILETNPPQDVEEKVYAYLDVMSTEEGRHMTIHSGSLEIKYGADSNVNSGPDNPTITYLGYTGQLDPATLQQRDQFTEFKADYYLTSPVKAGITFNTSLSAQQRLNSNRSELDTSTFSGNANVRFLHAQDTYTTGIHLQQFNVDNEKYRTLYGLDLNWNRNLSQKLTVLTFLQYSNQSFNNQAARDVNATALGFGTMYRASNWLPATLYASVFIANDTPESDSDLSRQIAEREYHGIRAGSLINTSNQTSLQLNFNHQASDYDLEDINGIKRQDKFSSADISFKWVLQRNWNLIASSTYLKNESNNTLNDYDRRLATISLQYTIR